MEYENLCEEMLHGTVIDVGGGDNVGYRPMLRGSFDYAGVNIDEASGARYVVQPGEKLPVEDAAADICLSMNTLEHVLDDIGLIEEIARITKPGGRFLMSVPFIFRVHGVPDDFSRHTASWWGQTLTAAGFEDVRITPLVWGRRSTMIGLIKKHGLRRDISDLADILWAKIRMRGRTGYDGRLGEKVTNIPVGYWITATRRGAGTKD